MEVLEDTAPKGVSTASEQRVDLGPLYGHHDRDTFEDYAAGFMKEYVFTLIREDHTTAQLNGNAKCIRTRCARPAPASSDQTQTIPERQFHGSPPD